MNTLEIKFIGAIGTVTGSCSAIRFSSENETHYYLVDIGEYQQEQISDKSKAGRTWIAQNSRLIEGIFITHAHYDHIGYLPEFVMEHGFSGTIYCTEATKDLMKIILEDALKVKKTTTYTINEVFGKIKFYYMDQFERGKFFSLTGDFRVMLQNSAHILGSRAFLFQWKSREEWRNLYFSGDIGSNNEQTYSNILLKEYHQPFFTNDNSEINIVLETTYGDKIKNKENLYERKLEKLTDIVKDAMSCGKHVLFPAFALNRAQEILLDLFYLQKKIGAKMYTIRTIESKSLENCLVRNNEKVLEDMQQNISRIWEKYFPNETIIWNPRISCVPDEMKTEIIELYCKYTDRADTPFAIKVHSKMINKVNEVYVNYELDTFKKKDGTLGYKYLPKCFFEKFGISDFNDNEKFQEAKNVVRRALTDVPEYCSDDDVKNKSKKRNNNSEKTESIKAQLIVSSSGMCDEGMILNLLKKFLLNENAVVVLSGYQAANTNGYYLKNMNKYDDIEKISTKLHYIDLRLADVKCKIVDLSEFYSGHADQDMLFEYASGQNGKYQNKSSTKVFLNHGQNEARLAMKKRLEIMENIKVEIPDDLSWYNLETGDKVKDECKSEQNNVIENEVKRFDVGDITILIPNNHNEQVFQKILEFLKTL